MSIRIIVITTLFFSSLLTIGQQKDLLKIYLKSGEVNTIEFKLRNYLGKLIFPDDSKNFIVGKNLGGEKVKINKADIAEIELNDGFRYRVIEDSLYTYIGYYVSQGKINVFESYPYGRSTFYGVSGPSTTINKTASLAHYEVTEGKVIPLNTKRKLKELAEECPELSQQLILNKDLKENHKAGEAFKFYNQACIDKPEEKPCVIVVFRRKKGQSDDIAKISIDSKQYEFKVNSIDTVRLSNYRNIKLCATDNSNCFQEVFNSYRFNYLEVSHSKKDLQTTIKYVDNEYGEYYATQTSLKAQK